MSAGLPPSIGEAFEVVGHLRHATPHRSGHIHATFVASYEKSGRTLRYVHQRLNTDVFADPEGLMHNVVRVTDHLRRKLAEYGVSDPERRCLELVSARDGRAFHVDDDGCYWRTYRYLEGSRSIDAVTQLEQAHNAGHAFGHFVASLADLAPPPLVTTIPHFHDLERRRRALDEARVGDVQGRAAPAAAALTAAFLAFDRVQAELEACDSTSLAHRVVHNDCKLNNVMFDDATGEALCVIDLDTVMEGTLLADFGDLVRTAAATAAEDERDLRKVDFDLERFGALARGYREGAGWLLGEPERRLLPLAGAVQALENGLRFLTDHLQGDVYFGIHRPGQNLDRALTQLRFVERMIERLPEARELFVSDPT